MRDQRPVARQRAEGVQAAAESPTHKLSSPRQRPHWPTATPVTLRRSPITPPRPVTGKQLQAHGGDGARILRRHLGVPAAKRAGAAVPRPPGRRTKVRRLARRGGLPGRYPAFGARLDVLAVPPETVARRCRHRVPAGPAGARPPHSEHSALPPAGEGGCCRAPSPADPPWGPAGDRLGPARILLEAATALGHRRDRRRRLSHDSSTRDQSRGRTHSSSSVVEGRTARRASIRQARLILKPPMACQALSYRARSSTVAANAPSDSRRKAAIRRSRTTDRDLHRSAIGTNSSGRSGR